MTTGTTPDQIVRDCKQKMDKSVTYLESELRGIRTGRASTALIDHVKVEYYGSMSDLRDIAMISVPEPTLLTVKPYDPTAKNAIIKALESAQLGLNPQAEGDVIRISVPAPSADRRKQLVTQVKKMAEESRIAVRNERRDGIKHIDSLIKDKTNAISEDQGARFKSDIEDATKKHIETIDTMSEKKTKEIEDL